MADIEQAALQLDSIIDLYIIDLSSVAVEPNSAATLYFTSQLDTDGQTSLLYGGNSYTAIPIVSDGFEISSKGSMPRPTVTIGNINSGLNTLLAAYGSFIGAKFTRIKVFYEYLDGKEKGGLGAFLSKDKWVINRKTNHNNTYIKFELKNPLDLENVFVPRGQFTRKCSFRYRRWDQATESFIYGTCPYTDETHNFDELGNKTSKQNDACGKRLNDCQIRFLAVNKQADIPGDFFPLIPNY
jgi:lambda family phage minor tail protein L